MRFLLLTFLTIGSFQAAFAQQASLEITITDQSAAIVPNLTARLKKDDKIVKETRISKPQKIIFLNIEPDTYLLEIESVGFNNYFEQIEIITGNNQKNVQLEIRQIVENVTVARSEREKNLDPRDGAFTNFLTRAEIEALPDDPELLKKALIQKFGEDAEFFVDGFTSTGLPRKAEIASIKVNQSSFDAEYHKIGVAIIEIATKPTAKFFGYLNFDFNDARLNARETFSPIRYPQQNRSFGLILWGPLKKEKTSFFVAAGNTNSYNTATVTAKLPTGNFVNSERSPANNFYFDGKITHNLSPFQTTNLIYSLNNNDSRNLGVGGFNLPERAFDVKSQTHRIRYSQTGNVGKRFYNEFRFQFASETSATDSVNKNVAIIVLDAFSKGGAGVDRIDKRQSFSVSDNFLWGIKNHALKIGGVFDFERQKTDSAENQSGTFIFSDLESFTQNRPSIFTQRIGNRNVNLSQIRASAFIQDDYRLHKNLMLSLGLRYEWQNNLLDADNFSPRIGFSWSPTENAKIVFRGGIGIFYNWFESDTLATILSQTENQPNETIILNPGFPNSYSNDTSRILPKSYSQKASDLQNPYTLLAQFGVQYQLSENSSFRIQYTYQKGIHQFRSRDVNAPIGFVRPNPNLGRISQFESSAFYLKNLLRISYQTTPTKTTFFSLDYRLGKIISDADGIFGLPSDNYNLRRDRAIANSDQRHILNAEFGWSLPKNLRLSTIFFAGSPLPYTITTGNDDNGDTIFNDRPRRLPRNSERESWKKQLDMSLSWKYKLGKTEGNSSSIAEPGVEIINGKTIYFVINARNILNQTNFTNFSGVEISPFFRQPISAESPRKIDFGIRFSF